MSLAGQRVVVIGGTLGIGLAVAGAAAAEGARTMVASRSPERIKKALESLPDGVEGVQLDVADEAGVEDFFGQLDAIDHVVYTAGEPIFMRPLREVTKEAAVECFGTRFWGALAVARHGIPVIRPGGSLTLTSGVIGLRPPPNVVVPAAVTGAVDAMVPALAVEFAPVRVNAVRLGPVPTGGPADIPNRQEVYRQVAQRLLLKRMGKPSEAAESYLYLMRAEFTTGVLVTTDGGFVLT
jgi:NAD(P)-dependent dehydrogenase (short-subunit alcohol dehydrogenase family)